MNPFVDEIANFIAAAGIGVIATDLFVGHMIPDPDNVLMVFGAGGEGQDRYLDTQYLMFDVWCRDRHGDAGYTRLYNVLNLLHRQANIDLGQWHAYFIAAASHILDMDKDSQGRKLYKLTFRAIVRDTNLVS